MDNINDEIIEKEKISILVVEDSPTQAEALKYYLENEGVEVKVAGDGVIALEILKSYSASVIISDIVMPNMDGYELCKNIRENPKLKAIPIILLTSLSDPSDIIKSIEVGANKFITKPIDPNKFFSVVKELLINTQRRKTEKLDFGIRILFDGKDHLITSDRMQLLDLLLSSYESAYLKNTELLIAQKELEILNVNLEDLVQQRTSQLMEEKQKAELLSKQNELLLDSAGDGIFGINNEGLIYFVNNKACELLGYEESELLYGNKHDLIHHTKLDGSHYPLAECPIYETLKYNKQKIVYEDQFFKKDGQAILVEYTSSPILLNGYGAVVIFRDITERKKLEDDIKEKDKMLIVQSRSAAMGDMISMIAHQWKQPLAVLSMFVNNIKADIALDDLQIESLDENLDQMGVQVQHLASTIDDFRDFFKPNKEKILYELKKTVIDTLELMGKSLEAHSVKVIQNHQSLEPFMIYPNDLMQVLINILKNAKEVLTQREIENKEINIKTYLKNNRAVIDIEDNAGGISDDIIDKVFDPYFTTKTASSGTGIGLYISKTIINDHFNGTISVKNGEKGARFIITLPLS
ncbi:MAG: response regulator [Campylobacterota bacterium]|nr:response regulator [Campylobacterota bacterium]